MNKALELDEGNVKALLRRAKVYCLAPAPVRDSEKAQADVNRVLQLEPGNGDAKALVANECVAARRRTECRELTSSAPQAEGDARGGRGPHGAPRAQDVRLEPGLKPLAPPMHTAAAETPRRRDLLQFVNHSL